MTDDQLRIYAKRLERYATKSREAIWKAEHTDALPNLAETAEIACQLYTHLQQYLQQPAPTHATRPALQDEADTAKM
jgi:hypothetical protein